MLLLSQMSLAQKPQPPQHRKADVLFVNADIYTGVVAAPGKRGGTPSRARALAIVGDRIVAIGTEDQLHHFKGRKTGVVNLRGAFVMPGFNDAHLHLAAGGLQKLNLDLTACGSLPEMLAQVAERAKTVAPGEWLIGRGWDQYKWPGHRLPTRQDLDAVTGGHPTFLWRVDDHLAVVNSAALKIAGITRETANPPGGAIDRDAGGEPTGVLREMALELVKAKIPHPTASQRRRAIELALEDAARNGVTSLQDGSTWEDFLVYEDLEREGRLTARITEWLPFNDALPDLQQHRAQRSQTDPMLHTGMVKAYLDGSLGSRTAAMLAPYSDERGNRGIPQYTPERLVPMSEERADASFQLGFHAIGDAAVRLALDTFSEVRNYAAQHNRLGLPPGTIRDFRFRIEHAQVVAPQDISRFHQLGVIASMQPSHLLTDMDWAMDRLGPERARHSYPWKELLDAGATLAFGTDYPIESISPFRGLYAAVTRKDETGKKEYFPDQAIDIRQAIAAYTSGAAYAEFAEKDKGTLEPGMLADFVVLDRNLTAVAPPDLLKTKVLRTVVGGQTVYEAEAAGKNSATR